MTSDPCGIKGQGRGAEGRAGPCVHIKVSELTIYYFTQTYSPASLHPLSDYITKVTRWGWG